MEKRFEKLPSALLPWYQNAHRDLPWRQTKEPYRVWLSEIMLQQTRVEAVKGYYARFLEALPTVEALVNCDDEQLHKLWEGLGYYSRVRNLKKAAQEIVNKYEGAFPQTYEQVLALPGAKSIITAFFCYCALEQTVCLWSASYLNLHLNMDADSAASMAALFYLGITGGRFISGFVTIR